MTALAACLFALATFASVLAIAASWRRHGRDALALRAQLQACPETLVICWKAVERVPVPALASLRTVRGARPVRQGVRAPGLDWPGTALAA